MIYKKKKRKKNKKIFFYGLIFPDTWNEGHKARELKYLLNEISYKMMKTQILIYQDFLFTGKCICCTQREYMKLKKVDKTNKKNKDNIKKRKKLRN